MLSLLSRLQEKSLNNESLTSDEALQLLAFPDDLILPLCYSAYEIRKVTWGKKVKIHIINNAKNGSCPENCTYCVQSLSSNSPISDYPMKSDDEMMSEAKSAYESGAFRYCMVFAGRGPSMPRVRRLASLIERIKSRYPLEICLSAGLMNEQATTVLKEAGLDRLNHNLNTSSRYYEDICTTHTYQDRINTLKAGQDAGLELCSGFIAGMGETQEDIVEVVFKLRELKVASIPVNFYMPIDGAPLKEKLGDRPLLNPLYCLKILALFRFVHPKAEIRIAAGREMHLRHCQVLGLYPANSLFMDGYLNTKGTNQTQTLQMIQDAGFDIDSELPLEELLPLSQGHVSQDQVVLKQMADLKKTF